MAGRIPWRRRLGQEGSCHRDLSQLAPRQQGEPFRFRLDAGLLR
jgi:hypothetical protein